ncbi:hypothetical protein BKA67DRAFT_591881 [Truncatella angustata]|uniref:CCZ1/INTU/HSP4 first Longin domain-containing protein n=1 Tax=Truncatella angustata TaxID=152316 RepID=A0A9P8ZZY6_9PEZI|nr:uncharacterized protein BKA67DRAFT_591881 [Truncatella angustata]KAH6655570.1 hypothetical protein BKA67DRAFT_591881 [Truncatella angustata]
MALPPPLAFPVSPGTDVVVPAQLGFLAIFNPSLGATDETIDDQIVYYASVNSQQQSQPRRRHRSKAKPTDGISQDERNERLRQIGLAQGMVEFGRGFADGEPTDVIETEKSRIVLRELEPGWWILASIDLTRLPLPPRLGGSAKDVALDNVEYSSREVKPALLLQQDLLRAHSIFLLHHGSSLSALFVRSNRAKFVTILSRYWDIFLSTWNVLLHGNPACAVFGGIKMAASGELGVGVGEEERGSGEREVLEGFVGRVEGLVDLVVCKYGDADLDAVSEDKASTSSQLPKWIGTGEEPGAEDGAIFLGVGSLSRKSLRNVTFWMEDLYTWGEDAYGVKESPTSTRTKGRQHRVKSVSSKTEQAKQPAGTLSTGETDQAKDQGLALQGKAQAIGGSTAHNGSTTKLMDYLKLGYGTHWSLGGHDGPPTKAEHENEPEPERASTEETFADRPKLEARTSSRPGVDDRIGHYLIGLQGDVHDSGNDSSDPDLEELQSRTLLRTLTVELERGVHRLPEEEKTQDLSSGKNGLPSWKHGSKNHQNPNSHFDSQDRNKSVKMRVVVYVSKPFIYTFLFQNRTDSLAWDSLYKSLHYQLEPLRKPLALSTLYRPEKPDSGGAASHIFDLIWDPRSLMIHSTIPSIPDTMPTLAPDSKQQNSWSRLEAMNSHMQIVQTFAGTRQYTGELERTCKTSRGWWVVWARILQTKEVTFTEPLTSDGRTPPTLTKNDSQDSEVSESTTESGGFYPSAASSSSGIAIQSGETAKCSEETQKPEELNNKKRRQNKQKVSKEIFLIRKAGESGSRSRSLSQISEGREGWADGASRLAQGIGVDTKKYIEGLLSLTQ